jgi:catalase
MGYSPDKMLQARLVSYPDAHRYRLGVNYDALPVNRAQCPVHTYHRDGAMRFDGNSGSAPNYEPNSFNGPTEDPIYTERPRPVTGTIDRYNHRIDDDYYSQPGNLFRLMKPDAKERLIGNIVSSLKNAPEHIQKRQVWHFTKADPAYGAGVAQALGLDASKINAAKKEEVFAD